MHEKRHKKGTHVCAFPYAVKHIVFARALVGVWG